MKFGVCTKVINLDAVAKAGYDYIEMQLNYIGRLTDEEFEQLRTELPLPVERTNLFFPYDWKIIGPEGDLKKIEEYCRKVLPRAAKLGVTVAVMGNGGARSVPEGYERAEAEAEFCKVLSLAGDIAAENGITIAIEPLRTKETNMINTVADGIALCKRLEHPNVKCLADFYHVLENGEDLSAIETAGDLLVHTHLAVKERLMPSTREDAVLCQLWAAALKACGFDGSISLEGHFGENFEDAITTALPILKESFC